MKPQDLMNLFQNFGKLEDKNKINPGGLGLGLNISKNICQKLGGSIDVSSELNVGSEFVFTIKLDEYQSMHQISLIEEIKSEDEESLESYENSHDLDQILQRQQMTLSPNQLLERNCQRYTILES